MSLTKFPVVSVPRATLFGCTSAVIVMFAEPSNDAEPDKSPARLMALAVCSVVAVLALPITGAVTAAKVTEAVVATSWPIAMLALEPSPGVCVTVTPVPETMSLTKFPVVSVPSATLFG